MAGIQPRHAGGVIPEAAALYTQRRVGIGPDKVAVAEHGHAGDGIAVIRQQRRQVVHGVVLLRLHLLRNIHPGGIGDGAVDPLDLHREGILRQVGQHSLRSLPQRIARQHLGVQLLQMGRVAVIHIVDVHIVLRHRRRGVVVRLRLILAERPLDVGLSGVIINDVILDHQKRRCRQDHQHQHHRQQPLLTTAAAPVVMIPFGHSQGWMLSSRPTRRAWRPPSNSVVRNTSVIFLARLGPIMPAPMASTLASLWRRVISAL